MKWIFKFKSIQETIVIINKKALLRERKRHTARCVVSTPSLPPSWPGRGGGGYLTRVPPQGTPPARYPPRPGYPSPRPGYPPPGWTWQGTPPAAPWHSGKCCKALWDMGTPPGVNKLTKWNHYFPVVLRTRAVTINRNNCVICKTDSFVLMNRDNTQEAEWSLLHSIPVFPMGWLNWSYFCTFSVSFFQDENGTRTNVLHSYYQHYFSEECVNLSKYCEKSVKLVEFWKTWFVPICSLYNYCIVTYKVFFLRVIGQYSRVAATSVTPPMEYFCRVCLDSFSRGCDE